MRDEYARPVAGDACVWTTSVPATCAIRFEDRPTALPPQLRVQATQSVSTAASPVRLTATSSFTKCPRATVGAQTVA